LLEISTDIACWLRLDEARLLRLLLEALRIRRNISSPLRQQPALLRVLLEELRILLLELGVLLLLELRILWLLLELRILLELGITTRKPSLHRILIPWLLPSGHGSGRRRTADG
jgi:hypothetical protein